MYIYTNSILSQCMLLITKRNKKAFKKMILNKNRRRKSKIKL